MEKIVSLKKSDSYTEIDKRVEAAAEKAREEYERKVVHMQDYDEVWFENMTDLLDSAMQDPPELVDAEKKERRRRLILAANWLNSFGFYVQGQSVQERSVYLDLGRYAYFRGAELKPLLDLIQNADDVAVITKPDGGIRMTFSIEGM